MAKIQKQPSPKTKEVKTKRFNPRDHWKGMPEYVSNDVGPVKALIVNFENMENVHKFAKLIGQPITAKTRSVWYPEVPIEGAIDKRWSDAEKPKAKKK